MKKGGKFYIVLALVVIETAALIWFSFLPGVEFIETGEFLRPGDLEHFVAYFVYSLLLNRLFCYFVLNRKERLFLSFMTASFAGGILETAQFFLPYRTGDVIDVKLQSCANDNAFQRSVERAVRKASPLPLPPNPDVFDREIYFTFKPRY